SDVDFLCQVFEAAIEGGATVINVPDTVGYAMPHEFAELIDQIRKRVRGIDKVILSVHCHNDLGLAVSNSLAAVQHGAQQVEVAVNGLGERAGNAALEELVMIIDTRGIYLDVQTDINISEIARTSHLVSLLTGYPVQPNKAVVGRNAFAHESGIHQDGVLKERTTYEIRDPQKLGFVKGEIVLGKHSGRHAFSERLIQLGYKLSEEELARAFSRFKSLADRKGEIKDEDLEAIVANEIKITTELFKLNYYQTLSGSMVKPTATVGLEINGRMVQKAAYGDGPVDASFRAVDEITGIRARLESYSIDAVTAGKDALGEVTVVVEVEDLTTMGRGVSTDIIEASILAYLNALNRAVEKKPEL
ncbi:2-isopropylmalate synthase, partial [Candidatus Hakubella thermalkaliphila]